MDTLCLAKPQLSTFISTYLVHIRIKSVHICYVLLLGALQLFYYSVLLHICQSSIWYYLYAFIYSLLYHVRTTYIDAYIYIYTYIMCAHVIFRLTLGLCLSGRVIPPATDGM